MRRFARLFALLALAAACLPVATAVAIPVTNTNDSGAGSLRAAIEAANANAGADSIQIGTTGAIKLKTALPTIVTGPLTITGPGAKELVVERDAVADFRIFQVNAGLTATISGLTVRGGREAAGAGILNRGNLTLTQVEVVANEAAVDGSGANFIGGGGILSAGSLTLRESFVHGNTVIADDHSTENVAAGGGVEVEDGPLTVERSTISGNVVEAVGGGDSTATADGAGLFLLGGPVTIEESTISGNEVRSVEGSPVNIARGGGIGGTAGVSLTGSTVRGNSADLEGPAVATEIVAGSNLGMSAGSGVRNSIVAEPGGDAESCSLSLPSGGFNLDEDGSCGFGQGSDLSGFAAGLDPVLRFNGGATPTHALLESSVAIDRGDSFGSSLDQRGLARPVDLATKSNTEGGDGADIGAFELQAPPPNPAPVPGALRVVEVAGDRIAPNTRIVSGPPRVTFGQLATFRFNATESQSSFQCKIDNRPWRGCRSPFRRKVGAGRKHLFRVRAIDRFGNVDPTPARFGWRVKRVGG